MGAVAVRPAADPALARGVNDSSDKVTGEPVFPSAQKTTDGRSFTDVTCPRPLAAYQTIDPGWILETVTTTPMSPRGASLAKGASLREGEANRKHNYLSYQIFGHELNNLTNLKNRGDNRGRGPVSRGEVEIRRPKEAHKAAGERLR